MVPISCINRNTLIKNMKIFLKWYRIYIHFPKEPILQKKRIMENVRKIVTALPEKKRYAELITAVLSVPVLITVLMLNISNLHKDPKNSIANVPLSTPSPSISTPTPTLTSTPIMTMAPQQCIQAVGPVIIVSPKEDEQVTRDPICLEIERASSNYCGIVWSYRINNGSWSDYMDKSICLYNLSGGKKTIDVRVKSIIGVDQIMMTRTINVVSTDSPTPIATTSAQHQ
jgi:hypothetical protein